MSTHPTEASSMSLLCPCSACARHVRVDDHACPFCGGVTTPRLLVPARPVARARLTRAAIFAGAAILSAACGDVSYEENRGEPVGRTGSGGEQVIVLEERAPDPVVIVDHGDGTVISDPIDAERTEDAEAERRRQAEARERERRDLEREERRRPACTPEGICPPYGAPPLRDEIV